MRDPFPCATHLETLLGFARKGLKATDVTIYSAPEKTHIQRAFERLEEHLRRRGVHVEPTQFPSYTAKPGWRLPHGKRFLDKAGVRP